METKIVACPHCQQRNRVPVVASGTPSCGSCHQSLPWVVDADDQTFAERAEAASVPVLVDLWAPWCGPCRMVSPELERVAADLAGQIKLVKVNVDDAVRTSQRFSVQAVPTLMLLRDGKVIARQAGAAPAATLKQWVNQQLGAGSTGR